MAKIPNTGVFSSRHLLMLSLALNVSLILKIVYEGEEVHNNNNSCLKNERVTSIAARARARARADFHKSRVVMSTTSSLSNSTCTDLTRGNNRIINLDQ
jgi:L-tryptophan--pyruvate aminotransferase